jgi:cytochrome oxidase Cu insertion factor (SCO1/SenC/PrrC family)
MSGGCYQDKMILERVLLRRTRLSTLLLAIFLLGAAPADLGPKDGAGLPPADLERIKIGEKAPDFTLENLDGKRIALGNYRGKKNLVLVFYRGHW